MPYYPSDSDDGHYEVNTIEEKIVSDYTGYNFDRIEELEVLAKNSDNVAEESTGPKLDSKE